MEWLAVFLVVVGALTSAGHFVIQRWLFRRKHISPVEFLFLSQGVATVALFVASPWWSGFGTPIATNARLFGIAIVGTGLVSVFIRYAGAKSREFADVSLTAPIQALTPGLVTFAAFGLGEHPTWQGWIGIALIAIGTYVHGREHATTLREYLQPFTLLRLPANFDQLVPRAREEALHNCRALRWAYAGAIAGTIGLIFDGLLARHGNVALGTAGKTLILTLCFGIVYFVSRSRSRSRQAKESRSNFSRTILLLLLGAGLLMGAGEVLFGTSFRIAPVAYIGSLKRLTILFTIILAQLFLHERQAARRLWPAGIITVGAMLLAFDGSIGHIIDRVSKGF